MSINENIKKRYDKYLPEIRPVAYDGIVDEQTYEKQNVKVVFLLKDANPDSYKDGNAYVHLDLNRTANTDDPKEIKISSVTWRNVCRWAKIIEKPQCAELDCYENGDYNVEEMRKYLNNIAVINIKKTFGKGVNENKEEYSLELVDAIESYYGLVEDEIEMINPNLVVCGGTFEYILPCYYPDKKERKDSVKILSSGARYFMDKKGRTFLEFDHPGSRTSPKILFAYFKETYNAWKKINEKENRNY